MKPLRFFYHYFKAKRAMSVHWRGSCTVVQHVVCKVPCETKWRARQPRLIMQGFARDVRIEGDTAIIS